jgi:pilus assembly protein CpaB
MNRRRVTGAIVAMALAGVGAVGLVSWANSTKNVAEASEAQTAVIIVDKQVPKGADAATIKAATHVGTVQQKALQPGALTSEAQIGNQVASSDLEPGDQLVKARLAAAVPSDHPDKVTVSATFSAERAVGGTIKAGDTVGVYLSFEPFDTNKPQSDTTTPDKTPNTTRLAFNHVLVTNVQTTDDPVSNQKNGQSQVSSGNYIVTLALTPAQSERFVFATEFGHVWLANEPATVKNDGTGIITLGNVYSTPDISAMVAK